MKKTKDNIRNSAVRLFNSDGIVNVRLQQIADEAFISIGNMAYHFKNKEAIVTAIHDEISQELKKLMAEMNVVPLFEYIDHYFHQLYLLQRHYSFFFTDMLEVFRAYPSIAAEHHKIIAWQCMQYEQLLLFNANRGVLTIPDLPGIMERIVEQLWRSSHMYGTYISIREKTSSNREYCHQIWAVLVPLMTKLGLQEYKQITNQSVDDTSL